MLPFNSISSSTHALNTVGGESKKAKQYWRHAFESPSPLPPSFLSGLLDREERGGEKLELAAAAVAKSYSPSSGRLLPVSHVLIQRSVISLNFRFYQRPGGGGRHENEAAASKDIYFPRCAKRVKCEVAKLHY